MYFVKAKSNLRQNTKKKKRERRQADGDRREQSFFFFSRLSAAMSLPKINSVARTLLRNVVSKREFSSTAALGEKTTFGGLKDQDRIFTNLYGDFDWGIKGAVQRVCILYR
jgi:hypothetical protein